MKIVLIIWAISFFVMAIAVLLLKIASNDVIGYIKFMNSDSSAWLGGIIFFSFSIFAISSLMAFIIAVMSFL